uniref:Interleukin-2 receptor subunit alpha n=1 Tax=Spermophilus dauricus TaxID=99837 RepID=A0A8C9UWF4_SPEDA
MYIYKCEHIYIYIHICINCVCTNYSISFLLLPFEIHYLYYFIICLLLSLFAEFCDNEPLEISYATFKALSYVNGTMLTCECKKGFRRIQNGSPYMLCTGNSSWENKCQCVSSPQDRVIWLPARPPGHIHNVFPSLPSEPAFSLPGHCQEPPAWEHEDTKRTYHFMVGQTLHYQCIQGYKTLHSGPFLSVCKTIHGGSRWTRPQLTCLHENELHLFSGRWLLSCVQRPCSLPLSDQGGIPDFTCHVTLEVATTMETFLFTMEYQIVGWLADLKGPLLTRHVNKGRR